MIKGLSLPALAEELTAQRNARQDYIVNTRALRFVANSTTGALDDTEHVTQFHAVNALTRIAQDSKSYDRAIELERFGGQLIDLKPSDIIGRN